MLEIAFIGPEDDAKENELLRTIFGTSNPPLAGQPAVVVGPKCEEAVRTLLLGESSQELIEKLGYVFRELESAWGLRGVTNQVSEGKRKRGHFEKLARTKMLLRTLGPLRLLRVNGSQAPTPQSYSVRVRHDVADVSVTHKTTYDVTCCFANSLLLGRASLATRGCEAPSTT